MPAVRRTKLMEFVWKIHPWIYRTSGGRLLGSMMGMPVLLLTTKGRKTGEQRTRALMYLPKGDACVVIASFAGEPKHPAWWLNLQADPHATVERRGVVTRVVAREAEGDERETLWREAVAAEGGYATYAERTTRQIPVVVLDPAAS